ncbi:MULTISPECIES: hypothetical protein [Paenibacillus]|uniref:Uncharacterized protein n=1 Tax=Paenibacillus helianthi TaxID=1349432 RepID=A0ABX3ENU2_9BACL|nr:MULTISPECIES: hypothetical protein [Paenibacillus]OKP84696.1 hypothetical protein A3844_18885 [Paenibacillus helianthi]OKP91540.1 hypothetical protein A3842_02670 [Paenibacillus sp. P3E]OKP92487.1 hypothetical protein A3848_08490 [Paenibacillus sp. P32E]OKP96501.1 hypothetical protein A3849_20635 [Paenibacillus sp. P46E]
MSAVHYELQYVNGQIEELESTFKTAEEARAHLKSSGLTEWIMAGGKHINPANVISIKVKEA